MKLTIQDIARRLIKAEARIETLASATGAD